VWQFEKQVHYTNVEMYRDTTDHRKIQKKMGAVPEKNGRSDQPFLKNKKKAKETKARTRAEQENYNEVRKKQRK
jgi:hypothetical protein